MQAQAYLPQISIIQVLETILSSRRISRSDQKTLMSVLLSKDSLNYQEQDYINRVFDSLHRGVIRVVD